MKKKPLSKSALETIASRFRAMGDASRLHLLQLLFQGEKSVQELCELSGMGQANVSKHLSILAEHGMVSKTRHGLFMLYSIADDTLSEICDIVCKSASSRYSKVAKELTSK